MTPEEVRKIVIDIIEDIAPDASLDNLEDENSLRDQVGLDSMDFLDIVMELRKRYGLEVPQEEYPELATMSSTVKYLTPKLADKQPV
jgi:acyl carrier protein